MSSKKWKKSGYKPQFCGIFWVLRQKLAREMLGGDGDLRKVKQFLCDAKIPLRINTN
jgi:hypothetical protein